MQQISDQAASRVSTLEQELDEVVSFQILYSTHYFQNFQEFFKILFQTSFFLEICKPGRRQIDR